LRREGGKAGKLWAVLSRSDFGGSVDGRKGVSGGGILTKQAESRAAYDKGANNTGNAGGEQPTMMDGFVLEGIIQASFEPIKIDGCPLNTNRFSLPVTGCFTVALQS
jgi:hypothetical protein